MSSHGPNRVFLLPEKERFDGTFFYGYKRKIILAARTHGVEGFLNGTIKSPLQSSITTTTSTPITPVIYAPVTGDLSASTAGNLSSISSPSHPVNISWHSVNPSTEEWVERNAWTLGLILHNCVDSEDLGIYSEGTAAEAWASMIAQFDQVDDLTKIDANRTLRNTTFNEGGNFVEHIKDLRSKKAAALNSGNDISDPDFRGIVLASLPPSYDNLIINMSDTATSLQVIVKLTSWWSHRHGDKYGLGPAGPLATQTATPTPPAHPATTSVLQTQLLAAIARLDKSNLKCTNCKRSGHIASDCFRPGGGKANQQPAWWRDRGGGAGGSSNGQSSSSSNQNTTVASAVTPANNGVSGQAKHSVLSAYTSPIASKSSLTCEVENECKGEGTSTAGSRYSVHVSDDFVPVNASAVNTSDIPYHNVNTYSDSGATDHCFVNRTDFDNYVETPLKHGSAAKKGTEFRIIGKGSVTKIVKVEGRDVWMTWDNALHTPELSANLVSVSQMDIRGYSSTFESGRYTLRDERGEKRVEGKLVDRMYMVEMGENRTMTARSHEKPTDLDTWHRRLGHAGVTAIKAVESRRLLDGLVIKESTSRGACEDCILGKHKRRPFDEVVTQETEVLERVHIDLFGPARVVSRGGKKYMMGITDGCSRFPTAYFLADKKSETTLEAFKTYHVMAELQTGKKLRRVRVDGGGEFDNGLWIEYAKTHGIILEFTTPYSSAQNGVAERKFGVILDGTRVTLIESGLDKDMWCEAANTHTYIRGLLPSGRNPDRIPAEVWSGKRQDISHLRPFGCTAYAHIPKEYGGSKLDARSVKCILIGYHGRRSYRLWDPIAKKLVISRDVIFEEGVGHRTVPTDERSDSLFEEEELSDRVQLEPEVPSIADDAPDIPADPLNSENLMEPDHVSPDDRAAKGEV